ncbi:MAG TPA: hypothetical protein VGG49_13350 [Steroidobacteraceae bacterium]|jgi:hypothetical protein
MGATAMMAGTVVGGYMKKKADDQSAALLQQEAGQSVASGIQGAIAENRKATYVASNARARSVAGGLASTSPSVINNVGLIKGQGAYDALTSIYQGEDRSSELDTRAIGMENEGNAAMVSGWIGGMSNVMKGTGNNSFYSKYGSS